MWLLDVTGEGQKCPSGLSADGSNLDVSALPGRRMFSWEEVLFPKAGGNNLVWASTERDTHKGTFLLQ